jgi:hypothetical protein
LRISSEQAQSEIFRERIGDFLNLTRPRATIEIQVCQRSWAMPRRSRINGQFSATVRLSDHDLAPELSSPSHPTWISYRATVAGANRPPAVGYVCLVPARGWSVISDIDDTIKYSGVGDRRQLIANTFLSPFSAVSGMSETYRAWEAVGTAFHYVSSSPWQLYGPLSRFLAAEDFPRGSIHLRTLQFRDPSFLQLVVGKKGSKIRAMRSLLRWYPDRRFILVGDAGEKDPELYGGLARRFPRQVAASFIRELPGRSVSRDRLRRAFTDVPFSSWQLFRDPAELSQLVEHWFCRAAGT